MHINEHYLLIFVLFLVSPSSVPFAQELVDIEKSNFNKQVFLWGQQSKQPHKIMQRTKGPKKKRKGKEEKKDRKEKNN